MFRARRLRVTGIVLAATIVLAPTVWHAAPSTAATAVTPGSPASTITAAPVRPAHCTKEQMAAVTLDDCAHIQLTDSGTGLPVVGVEDMELLPDGELSLGELTAFLLYLNAFFQPIQQLVQQVTSIRPPLS